MNNARGSGRNIRDGGDGERGARHGPGSYKSSTRSRNKGPDGNRKLTHCPNACCPNHNRENVFTQPYRDGGDFICDNPECQFYVPPEGGISHLTARELDERIREAVAEATRRRCDEIEARLRTPNPISTQSRRRRRSSGKKSRSRSPCKK